jgi:uncharacterized SAM-binding protein YcdF (DUF218 family)
LFFVLSKTIGIALLPANFLIGIGLLGAILLATRLASFGRRLLIASAVLLAVCGLSPLGNLLLHPLEARFPPWDPARGAPDGIVVLGGAIDAELSADHGTVVFTRAADRVVEAAALARQYPKARIIFSGGSANLTDGPREADYAAAIFERLGVARDRLIMERRSRNTMENAEFSKELAAPKGGERWLLVTSAFHMPRSIGIFRKVGFAVEPCPVDWRTGRSVDWLEFSPFVLDGLERTEIAVREYLGLVAYRISGRTSELFPGPNPQ